MPRVVTNISMGDRVYRLRAELGWSARLLATHMQAAGHPTWHHTQVYMTESGTRHLRVYEGYSLSDILRVSLEGLAFGLESDDIRLMLANQGNRLVAERAALLERLVVIDKLLVGYGRADLRYGGEP